MWRDGCADLMADDYTAVRDAVEYEEVTDCGVGSCDWRAGAAERRASDEAERGRNGKARRDRAERHSRREGLGWIQRVRTRSGTRAVGPRYAKDTTIIITFSGSFAATVVVSSNPSYILSQTPIPKNHLNY